MTKRQRLGIAGLLCAVVVWALFVRGFFYPDEDMTAPWSYGIHRTITLVLQYGSLAATPLLLCLVWLLLVGRVRPLAIILPIAGITAAMLLLYPALVELFFVRDRQDNASTFHPYLQLTPPSFRSVAGATNIVFLGGGPPLVGVTRWGFNGRLGLKSN